jgi:hypothetical protein
MLRRAVKKKNTFSPQWDLIASPQEFVFLQTAFVFTSGPIHCTCSINEYSCYQDFPFLSISVVRHGLLKHYAYS